MIASHRSRFRAFAVGILTAASLLHSSPAESAPISLPVAASVRLYGYVVLRADGSPLEGIVVDIWDDFGGDLGHPQTNSEGMYEEQVPARDVYYLRFTQWIDNGPYNYHKYFTEEEQARPEGAAEVRRDATMRPAANVMLEYYDQSGTQVRFEAFALLLGGYANVTDPQDVPVHWQYNAVRDPVFWAHGSDWNWALPTIILQPSTTFRLHLDWTIRDVGHVIIDLDDGADGYRTPAAYGYRLLNVNRELALSAIKRLQAEMAAFSSEGVHFSAEVAGALTQSLALLAEAEAHWTADPPERTAAVADWELALSTAILADEQVYLEKAVSDIPRYRMGGLTLNVRDAQGQPIPGTVISYTQRTRDFLFSGGGLTDGYGYISTTAELMYAMGINAGAVGVPYALVEPSPGVFDWTYLDEYSSLNPMEDHGLSINASVAYYAYPDDWDCPLYWSGLSWEQYKTLLFNHYRALARRYGTRMDPWMINEPNSAHCLDLSWDPRFQTVRAMMDGLNAGHPGLHNLVAGVAMTYIWGQEPLSGDATGPPASVPFTTYLDRMIARGLPLDNLGLEMHFFGVSVVVPGEGGGYALPGLTLGGIARQLDRYSAYQAPLWIEPFQVPSTMQEGSRWWHRPWDQATQAEFATAFYTLAFSRKYMHDICWSDATDRAPFIVSAGLLDRDRKPKPAYYALRALLSSWMSSGTLTTDEKGEVYIRGYGGEYELWVERPQSASARLTAHISEQVEKRRSVTLHTLALPLIQAQPGRLEWQRERPPGNLPRSPVRQSWGGRASRLPDSWE